jgi:hypothetical protein
VQYNSSVSGNGSTALKVVAVLHKTMPEQDSVEIYTVVIGEKNAVLNVYLR